MRLHETGFDPIELERAIDLVFETLQMNNVNPKLWFAISSSLMITMYKAATPCSFEQFREDISAFVQSCEAFWKDKKEMAES